MSEEILKALMQLFAIIAKQDNGAGISQRNFVEKFLILQVSQDKVVEYLLLYDQFVNEGGSDSAEKRTSVRDSVRTLAICKKINKTLAQKQKVVVFIRLWEFIRMDNLLTPLRIQIVNTISEVFNIVPAESKAIEHFVINDATFTHELAESLVISDNKSKFTIQNDVNHIYSEGLNGFAQIIKITSVNLLFLKYNGSSDIYLNGLPVNSKHVYLLPPGSTIRLPRGTLYYSDIVSKFIKEENINRLSFVAKNIGYKFPNNSLALREVNINAQAGELIGIMGASGAGKTTLLNILSGIEKPSTGNVSVNGKDIHKQAADTKGVIGYISQDDLLMEDLTVYQNLYYNAKLCFKNLPEAELEAKVLKQLEALGLLERKDIIVGNALNKKISGGQRKRLNIALELIREPLVLFVDEPTSGLSSRDSENVMDLLKELTLKGKLIFVVIHQPSSDIYKMFDKLVLLDTGGYPIYYGNPIEAVMYFKRAAKQANSDVGECHICGSVNPELLFNIIESKEVDEYGTYTSKRKVQPEQWNKLFNEKIELPVVPEIKTLPGKIFNIPGRIKQMSVFIARDLFSKLSNKQYLLINFLEAPLLAFILSFIVRYYENPESDEYIFRLNENVPAYIFMSIIVILFIGLTVSAEEIYKDQRILKRERLLNLSRFSYLSSKLVILFSLSAIQALLFVLVGNSVIGLKGMFLSYWLMLFSVSCCANLIGLNISSTFNSAVTIYIIIPILLIPQMILGGAMFSFEKLNIWIGGSGIKPPVVSDLMISRWAYEGLMVNQFMNNKFDKAFYEQEQKVALLNFKQVYFLPALLKLENECSHDFDDHNDNYKNKFSILMAELHREADLTKINLGYIGKKEQVVFSKPLGDSIVSYIDKLGNYYTMLFNKADEERNGYIASFQKTNEDILLFKKIKNEYSNESVTDIVKNKLTKNKISVNEGRLCQQLYSVYVEPDKSLFSVRTHFMAPLKYFFTSRLNTFAFNVIIIWLMSLCFFITLYFDVLKKVFNAFSKKRFAVPADLLSKVTVK